MCAAPPRHDSKSWSSSSCHSRCARRLCPMPLRAGSDYAGSKRQKHIQSSVWERLRLNICEQDAFRRCEMTSPRDFCCVCCAAAYPTLDSHLSPRPDTLWNQVREISPAFDGRSTIPNAFRLTTPSRSRRVRFLTQITGHAGSDAASDQELTTRFFSMAGGNESIVALPAWQRSLLRHSSARQ